MSLNPSFTRGEYWLLETVVQGRVPLCWLDWEQLEEAINKQGHGMSRPVLVDTLNRLFADGLIEASTRDDDELRFTLDEQQIETALDERQTPDQRETYYGLTAKGGAYWEAFAAPNWMKFIDAGYGMDEQEETFGEIICADRDLLERYVQGLHYADVIIDPTTLAWGELRPWQATYWKQLPVGYKAMFQYWQHETEDWSLKKMPLSYYWLYENRWYNWR